MTEGEGWGTTVGFDKARSKTVHRRTIQPCSEVSRGLGNYRLAYFPGELQLGVP